MRREPHCTAEDLGGVVGVAGDVEEAVGYAPAAAEGEGDAVADKGDLNMLVGSRKGSTKGITFEWSG